MDVMIVALRNTEDSAQEIWRYVLAERLSELLVPGLTDELLQAHGMIWSNAQTLRDLQNAIPEVIGNNLWEAPVYAYNQAERLLVDTGKCLGTVAPDDRRFDPHEHLPKTP